MSDSITLLNASLEASMIETGSANKVPVAQGLAIFLPEFSDLLEQSSPPVSDNKIDREIDPELFLDSGDTHDNGIFLPPERQVFSATPSVLSVERAMGNESSTVQVRVAIHSMAPRQSLKNPSNGLPDQAIPPLELPASDSVIDTAHRSVESRSFADFSAVKESEATQVQRSSLANNTADNATKQFEKNLTQPPLANSNRKLPAIDRSIVNPANVLGLDSLNSSGESTFRNTGIERGFPDKAIKLLSDQPSRTVDPIQPKTNDLAELIDRPINNTMASVNRLQNNLIDANALSANKPVMQEQVLPVIDAANKKIVTDQLPQDETDITKVVNDSFNKGVKILGSDLRHSLEITDHQVKQYQQFKPLDKIVNQLFPDAGLTAQQSSAIIPVNSSAPAVLTQSFQMETQLNAPGWTDELGDQIQWITKQNLQSVAMKLNPAHLGSIEVKIQMQNDQATIQFSAMNSTVKEALEMAIPKLREMMDANGIQLANVEIDTKLHEKSEHRQQNTSENDSGLEGLNQGDQQESETNTEKPARVVTQLLNTGLDLYA